ncbi:unnamed protein product [Phyllotreta striolata]|uniref:DNA 3'-5' helicase n=1 Tax=Phyllotreta striolata TaxID=444603 RepID=A0A9N9U0X7_PHYSR|nr:unnamed protein product [Phyllotreta striolata]
MMDYLDEERQETYNKCKYIVKLWEHEFKKEHKRIPSKLDIREANSKVKNAYKKYFQLKSVILDQSFKDIVEFDDLDEEIEKNKESPKLQSLEHTDNISKCSEKKLSQTEEENKVPENVWGAHLNHPKEETKPQEPQEFKPSINSTISKKLFCGSKFTKRNPRKSLSFSRKSKSSSQQSVSFASFTSEEAINFAQDEDKPDKFKIHEGFLSQPTKVIQTFFEDARSKLKTVDAGWLDRVSGITTKSNTSFEYTTRHTEVTNDDSDDVIENSDDEDTLVCSQFSQISKRRKIETSPVVSATDIEQTKDDTQIKNTNQESEVSNNLQSPIINKEEDQSTDSEITKKTSSSQKTRKPKATAKKTRHSKTKKDTSENELEISPRRSARGNKVKASFKEFSSDEELDPFHTDSDREDPEFRLDNTDCKTDSPDEKLPLPPVKKPKGRKPKQTSKSRPTEEEQEEEPHKYDLEFSVKPRTVVSRYGSVKNILKTKNKELIGNTAKEEGLVKDKEEQAREKLEQKISSGTLNDNFVKINIRKKVFVRGKTSVNFKRYKKTQWKKAKAKALAGPDMDMGGCDGGMLTCFNCGQVGHFAQACPHNKGDALLPLNAAEDAEECPFPTLEEASKMAEESHLNIRKSKLPSNEDNPGEDPFSDEDSEELLLETMKLEEHIKKLDVQVYMDSTKDVESYYKLDDNGSVIDTPQEVFQALEKFGHSSFRHGQERAIMRILSGQSTLVTLSTGSGKSLCYQLPAYLYSQREPCISLVISPLVSLMDDQVVGIAKCLKAACLHSNQTGAQRKKILDAIALGELNILLVSPEAVVSGEKQRGFGSFLRKLPPIAFACIDEAHCVSQWSHNFRPSYLMICRVLRESLGVKTILGLTATATEATRTSIIRHLGIPDGERGVISDVPLPDNLELTVSRDPNRDRALLDLLLSDRFKRFNSIIIYCTRRLECERIAAFLRTALKNEQPLQKDNKKRKRASNQAEPYHAGLSASRRKSIQNAFMSGQLRVVVATVAFGMGINKSDIRAVVHYNMPSSFESYVQEIGRAGRDGLEAHCHVFLDSSGNDIYELRRHIHSSSIDRQVIRKLLDKVFVPCVCKEKCPKHEVAFSIEAAIRALDIPEENVSTLLCYLELHANKYIELLSPAYTTCKIISYAGPLQIRKAAKDCPPLAMALALYKDKQDSGENVLEFPVIDVAAAMGWESGICKFKLKNLEWITVNNQQKRSTLSVQFSDLGFRLLAPGNLSGDQLDEVLDVLYDRVVEQEKTALLQLNAIHATLREVALPSFRACLDAPNDRRIKSKVREYFDSSDCLKAFSLTEYPEFDEDRLAADVRAIVCMYRDNNFTARTIARIFQGIQSPNYPAVIWGRCKFWRSHLDKDFHVIVKTAIKELIKMR